MRRWSILLTALLLLTFVRDAQAKDPFEGTKWDLKMMPDDDARHAGQKPFDETLAFKGSKLTAETMKKLYAFKEATYDEDARLGGIGAFTAVCKSDKEGTAKWTGTVTATSIKGDLVWTKADGTVLNFSYTGEKKTS